MKKSLRVFLLTCQQLSAVTYFKEITYNEEDILTNLNRLNNF